MPTAAWPAISFIDKPDSFREKGPQGNVLRTKMDQGPVKSRRRFTAASRMIAGQTGLLTQAQLDTFETWFDDTIASGALPFTAIHPRSGTTETFRFTEDYAIIYEHDDMFRVDMSLEVLP